MPAVITSTEGRRLSIAPRKDRSVVEGEVWSFDAELTTAEASARARIHDLGAGLVEYWHELARDWQGWNGERRYVSLEGQLSIECASDELGQVVCTVTLGRPGPPTWSLRAEMSLGGGSHVQQFAADLARVLG